MCLLHACVYWRPLKPELTRKLLLYISIVSCCCCCCCWWCWINCLTSLAGNIFKCVTGLLSYNTPTTHCSNSSVKSFIQLICIHSDDHCMKECDNHSKENAHHLSHCLSYTNECFHFYITLKVSFWTNLIKKKTISMWVSMAIRWLNTHDRWLINPYTCCH